MSYTSDTPSRHCGTCRAVIPAGDRFCQTCGAPQLHQPSNPTPPLGMSSPPNGSPYNAPQPSPDAPTGAAGQDSTPHAPSHNRSRALALAAAVVVVAAGAAGGTLVLTRPAASNKAALIGARSSKVNSSTTLNVRSVSTTTASSAGPAASRYSSFSSEYSALKGAIARIDTVGCDGSAYVGSGFAVDAHHIVTAAHVVEGSQSMTVTLAGTPVPSQIIGLDASGDVALLQSDSALPGPYISIASTAPAVGQRVAAIGFPLGGGLTMTQGSVSALGQTIAVNSTQLSGLVQTDTALNPGNSGGPLLALDGTARGIVDALATPANATGYAISPNYASSEVTHWLASPESHPLPLCTAPNPLGSVAAASPSSPSPSGESADAQQISAILSQSASARSTVVSATQAVTNCSADPNSEASQIQTAVAQRQAALQQLGAITGSGIPNESAILSDLQSALTYSDQADQDYMAWMSDIEGDSCPYPTTSDPNFQAASSASTAATSAKNAFLGLWNPVASQLNLPQYSQSQI